MYRDLTELNPGLSIMINGEAYFQEEETDHNNGTGIKEGWTADVYGLLIEVNGKEYTIKASALSVELIQAIEAAAKTELDTYY